MPAGLILIHAYTLIQFLSFPADDKWPGCMFYYECKQNTDKPVTLAALLRGNCIPSSHLPGKCDNGILALLFLIPGLQLQHNPYKDELDYGGFLQTLWFRMKYRGTCEREAYYSIIRLFFEILSPTVRPCDTNGAQCFFPYPYSSLSLYRRQMSNAVGSSQS